MTIHVGNVLAVLPTLPRQSVQTMISSPPYWGLRAYGTEPQVWGGAKDCRHDWTDASTYDSRHNDDGTEGPKQRSNAGSVTGRAFKQADTCLQCGGWRGELGAEPTPEQYVANIVAVFREVWRVLRDDGTLWLNLGDSYAAGKTGRDDNSAADRARLDRYGHGGGIKLQTTGNNGKARPVPPGLKPKDLVGIPWRVAFALQADGWYLRSAMPWVKRNCMPESVRDRPTSAIEYVFLFSKRPRYFWDAEAVKRAHVRTWDAKTNGGSMASGRHDLAKLDGAERAARGDTRASRGYPAPDPFGRNYRNSDMFYDSLTLPAEEVAPPAPSKSRSDKQGDLGKRTYAGFNQRWDESGKEEANAGPAFPPLGMILDEDGDPLALDVNPQPFAEAHFATFPEKLVEPMVLAGTSERGCCAACGAPWRRTLEKQANGRVRHRATAGLGTEVRRETHGLAAVDGAFQEGVSYKTTGWVPTCACATDETAPCVVLDPFAGSGTVGVVCERLGRRFVGVELNADYVTMAQKRIAGHVLPLFAEVW